MLEIEFVRVEHREYEQIIFRVVSDCNLWPYIVFDVGYDEDGHVSNALRHSFVFPNLDVSAGDFIVLRSGRGRYDSFPNRVKTKTHIFYWGFEDNVVLWRNGSKALIVKASEYKFASL